MNDSITTQNLISELRNIFDDDEFVRGILTFADNEEDRTTLLKFIQAGDDVDIETVCVMAVELSNARENQ